MEQNIEDTVVFYYDWLKLESLNFKIMLLIRELSDNGTTYKGNLKSICNGLKISSCSKNNKRIRQAIEYLTQYKYITSELKGNTYTLTINENEDLLQAVAKIRKEWINTIKTFNKDNNNERIDKDLSADWVNMLKVFIFAYNNREENVKTQADMARILNMSIGQLRCAIKLLLLCEFDNSVEIKKKIERWGEGEYWRTRGTKLYTVVDFTK